MRYHLEVQLAPGDVGRRVVIRWRRPARDGDETADVLGILEAADAASFTVRGASGELVTIPRNRALAGRTVPSVPRRRLGSGAGEPLQAVRAGKSSRRPGSAP